VWSVPVALGARESGVANCYGGTHTALTSGGGDRLDGSDGRSRATGDLHNKEHHDNEHRHHMERSIASWASNREKFLEILSIGLMSNNISNLPKEA
jgi:hypothetical protein